LAIVTERWDGMRWTLRHRARDGIAGRDKLRERSRCVLTSDAEAYGEVVWTRRLNGWRQVFRRSRKPDRARVPNSGRRRGQESPIPRDEREISRRAIAQGMSDCLRCPVCSCALSFALLHTRPRVQRASGIPCSLPLEGQRHANLGCRAPRECEGVFSFVGWAKRKRAHHRARTVGTAQVRLCPAYNPATSRPPSPTQDAIAASGSSPGNALGFHPTG
jgi:hypothetical protein